MAKVNLGPVSAYAIAVKNGFEGTEQEWLESLKGKGAEGGVNSWNDLPDKPFGEEAVVDTYYGYGGCIRNIVVPAGTYPADAGALFDLGGGPDGDEFFYTINEDSVGNPIWVEFDGTVYELEVERYINPYDITLVTLGFGNTMDFENPDIPFGMKVEPSIPPVCYFYVADKTVPHTVSIFNRSIKTTTIPDKCIPETIARKTDRVDWNNLINRPFYYETIERQLLPPVKVPSSSINIFIPQSAPESFNPPSIENGSDVANVRHYMVIDGVMHEGCIFKIEYVDDLGQPIDKSVSLGSIRVYWHGLKEDTSVEWAVSIDGAEVGQTIEVIERYDTLHRLSAEYLPKAEAVADVIAAPTAANFNALLASLRAAGYLSE